MSRIGVATGRVSCLLFSLLILLSGHSCQPRASTRSDAYGVTPLMRACFRGNLKLARLLIEKGANPNARTRYGFTPLIYAASSGDADDAVSVQVADGTATLTQSWTVGKRLMSDLNSDNQVNFADFLDLVTAFGKASGEDGFNAAADLDDNLRVEFSDFLIFARYFGLSSP